jgi:AraC-like DNA-binding protein
MELFYYPTMSNDGTYQLIDNESLLTINKASEEESKLVFSPHAGDVKASVYTLLTGNLVISMMDACFREPFSITRNAYPVNDMYILSFDVSANAKVNLFSSATTALVLSKQAAQRYRYIEVRISRAYLLKMVLDLTIEKSSSWAKVIATNETFQERFHLLTEEFKLLESVFELFVDSQQTGKINTALLENKIHGVLFSFLDRLFKDEIGRANKTEEHDHQKILEVQTVIKNNIANKYKIPELSTMCNMCPTKFKQLFKRITGNSVSVFYNELRMEKALDWLNKNPQGNISELAYDLGYKSLSHFTAAFKNYYGYAPTIIFKQMNQANTWRLKEVRVGKSA